MSNSFIVESKQRGSLAQSVARPLRNLEDVGSNPAARCLPIFLLLIIIQQLSCKKKSIGNRTRALLIRRLVF